ncbi:Major facilitator superfamily domain, general substrate transporter [Pleurostoma richardsiae]|uniref:Major facilitator superfamily domain, general substrate transporter n=1 Tax=Pleurostoma richardsiae TaxID=41990 RepID=A0AA38VBR7_9PEZI|nr:Major facilitator superfamily domain, general substrate transporter [Pleurostoma richardsiae]
MHHEEEHHARHLIHSHAHEEDIPGTVNLRAAEGDDTAYGQALFPVPAEDPNDPLQWPSIRKISILAVCSLYSFLGNSSLLGPSVYIGIFSEDFGITPNKASGLISYANLAFGFGSLLLVPLYHKFGRRPVMLASLVFHCVGLIAASRATSYGGLMAARIVHAFGSGVCEALPVQLVNDIFFLHERGKRLGIYTVCLCFGSSAPLFAGYMLNAGYSWRLFFYVEFAFAGALLIIAFLVVEETTYHRKTSQSVPDRLSDRPESRSETDKASAAAAESASLGPDVPPRKTFLQTLKFWGVWERDSDFFLMMLRSFTYFLVPQVLWSICTYGLYIGLGALAFNYTFPLKITAPPYNWSELNSGLLAVATIIGYALAIPFTPSSDILAAKLTRRNGGIREAEMRLGVMLPAMLLAPAGLVVYGFAAERNLHWVAYFIGVAMDQFASYFYFTFTLAYAIDSYQANTSEMLIAMNLGKQAISFGMGINLLEWVLEHGYAVMIAGVFGGILLANNLMLVVFMLWGKKIRAFMAKSWLARIHSKSIREVAVA